MLMQKKTIIFRNNTCFVIDENIFILCAVKNEKVFTYLFLLCKYMGSFFSSENKENKITTPDTDTTTDTNTTPDTNSSSKKSSLNPSFFSSSGKEKDMYGGIPFILFYSSVLSRLAYMDDTNFLDSYSKIFGNVITKERMEQIDAAPINDLLDDEKIYGIKEDNCENYKTIDGIKKCYLPFIDLAKKVNQINKEESTTETFDVVSLDSIKFISIATSNYGEIYVIADLRTPNTMWVVFRGTYSAKTFASYSKPTSLAPINIGITSEGKNESYLYGIYKITIEVMHTIVEAMRYLGENYLQKAPRRNKNPIKILTTGHSLGGAMSTIFAYNWSKIKDANNKSVEIYQSGPYAILSTQIGCFSLGSPLCVNNDIADMFCEKINNYLILYVRVGSKGDPITGLPYQSGYFSHPCPSKEGFVYYVKAPHNGLLTLMYPKYMESLESVHKKWRPYIPNMTAHMEYLDITFKKALDPDVFMTGIGTEQEIKRVINSDTKNKDTICRIVLYDKKFYSVFFSMYYVRSNTKLDDATIQKAETEEEEDPTIKSVVEDSETPQADAQEAEIEKQEVLEGAESARAEEVKPVAVAQEAGGVSSKSPDDIAEDDGITKENFDALMNNKVGVDLPSKDSRGILAPIQGSEKAPRFCCIGLKTKQSGGRRNISHVIRSGKKRTRKQKSKNKIKKGGKRSKKQKK